MKLTKISLSFLFGCMATLPIKAQIVQEAVCENDSIEIGLPAFIQNESIQWMSSNDTVNFSDLAGDTLTTLNVAPTSPTYFVARITGDNCNPYFSDTVFVNISLAPSVADAGADITDTSNTTTLGANTPTVGTGTWSILPGSGTNGAFNSVNDPNCSIYWRSQRNLLTCLDNQQSSLSTYCRYSSSKSWRFFRAATSLDFLLE